MRTLRLAIFGFLIAAPVFASKSLHSATLPLSFEPNTGQVPDTFRYLARGNSYLAYFGSSEIVVAARGQEPLRMKMGGTNPLVRILGEGRQESTSNYFIGGDPDKWLSSVPNYSRIRYQGVYPGIDLVAYGKDGALECDWVLAPFADPRNIRINFDSQPRINRHGDLVTGMRGKQYVQKSPVIFQEIEGRRTAITGGWVVNGHQATFHIGAYDRSKELVIDPPLIFSTYYGGTGADYAYAVAVDSIGSTYVAGSTGSANFNIRGPEDAFVTKLGPDGSRLFTTFIGGGGSDEAHGIAVDVQGNIYVTGNAGSLDFPVKNAIQTKAQGSGDAFVMKLNAGGAEIAYSSYLGGSGNDTASAIAIDPAGNAYVIGTTFSADFPVQNPFQSAKGAQQDAFLAKINPAGSALVYSTYLGGNNVDEGNGIAVDAAGNAYLTGYTASTNFPVQSPFRGSNLNSVDAFVTMMNPAGSALVYSTYLGGSGTDYGTAIAIDSSGSAYVTGVTASDDFPLAGPIDSKLGSHAVDDVFVTKLTPYGSALVYSTYLGGGSEDEAFALALDRAGDVFLTGRTNSSDFPLVNPLRFERTAFDMFVTELDSGGSSILFSTFIGGSGSESGRGIAVDLLGNIHIAGEGTSNDFPVLNATQSANGGGPATEDALILVLGDAAPSNGPVITQVSDNLIGGGPVEPGGWFYVKGTDLSETTRIWGASDFTDPTTLPTDLNGVEVWVNGSPSPVYFISPGQVNAQAPSDISGTISVQVVRLGFASNTLNAPVAAIQPSLYNYQVGGKAYAAALFQDYALMGDPAVTPGTRKAKPGDVIQLYAAGLAPTRSGAVSSPIPITGVGVAIGTTECQVLAADLVAPGQFQVNFIVPQLADGEYQIFASVSGKTSPSGVYFEIGQ